MLDTCESEDAKTEWVELNCGDETKMSWSVVRQGVDEISQLKTDDKEI